MRYPAHHLQVFPFFYRIYNRGSLKHSDENIEILDVIVDGEDDDLMHIKSIESTICDGKY